MKPVYPNQSFVTKITEQFETSPQSHPPLNLIKENTQVGTPSLHIVLSYFISNKKDHSFCLKK